MEKRRNFKPEEKAKIVIEILKEEKTLNEIAAEYEMVNRWFGVGQFLSGAMGQLYPGGDRWCCCHNNGIR